MEYRDSSDIIISLPVNVEEFEAMKSLLKAGYEFPDQPEVWYTIASHIQSKKAWETTVEIKELANVGRKVIINRIAQDQKEIEGAKIQAKLALAMEKAANEYREEEARNPSRIVPQIPEADGSDVSDRTHRIP